MKALKAASTLNRECAERPSQGATMLLATAVAPPTAAAAANWALRASKWRSAAMAASPAPQSRQLLRSVSASQQLRLIETDELMAEM